MEREYLDLGKIRPCDHVGFSSKILIPLCRQLRIQRDITAESINQIGGSLIIVICGQQRSFCQKPFRFLNVGVFGGSGGSSFRRGGFLRFSSSCQRPGDENDDQNEGHDQNNGRKIGFFDDLPFGLFASARIPGTRCSFFHNDPCLSCIYYTVFW